MSTLSERTALYPVTQDWIYLNHAAVGPMPRVVRDGCNAYLDMLARMGQKHWEITGPLLETLRGTIAALLGAHIDDVAFTRNVSEGISLLAAGFPWEEGDNVVIPQREFPANVYPWLRLAHRGVSVRYVPMPEGSFSTADIERCLDARTRIVSLSSVQFFNGFMADLADIGALCRERGIVFCVDAIQHLGIGPLNVASAGIDFLACGGHKWLCCGEGFGFVCCRPELAERLRPGNVGWQGVKSWEDFFDHSLEEKDGARRLETGCLSALGIHALTRSLALLNEIGLEEVHARVRRNAQLVLDEALRRGFSPVTIRPADDQHWSGIVSFAIPGKPVTELVEDLNRRGVQVSARQGVMRVSPHHYNTADEIRDFFTRLDDLLSGP